MRAVGARSVRHRNSAGRSADPKFVSAGSPAYAWFTGFGVFGAAMAHACASGPSFMTATRQRSTVSRQGSLSDSSSPAAGTGNSSAPNRSVMSHLLKMASARATTSSHSRVSTASALMYASPAKP